MKQITIRETINLYELNELSKSAKRKAIEEHRDFVLGRMAPEDFISGDAEYDTEEKLQEAYNSEYEYYENNDEPIIELIEINEYLFYEDGEMANCITYVETGITELKHNGKIYRL